MSTATSRVPEQARQAAAYYLDRFGFLSVPLRPRTKKPIPDDWPNLRPGIADLEILFPEGENRNIGLLLGKPSGGLIDVDLDVDEAIAAAPLLLPPTKMISGRKSKMKSHWWYLVDDPPEKASQEYKDTNGSMLCELRSTGGQTVVAPSVHEENERIGWHCCDEPARVPIEDLRKAVARVAAVALLARHWPSKGSRHDAALAFGGALARSGMPAEDAVQLMRAVCAAANDDEVADRVRAVEDSYAKIVHGEPTTGWPELGRILGEGKALVVSRLQEWVGCPRVSATPATAPLARVDPPWPDPLAGEALHGLAGDIVRTIEPASEADPAALLLQLLVGFGNLAGRTAHYRVEADQHFANQFVVLIGRTSKARKGTSWGRMRSVLQPADEVWAEQRVQTGLSSGEGLIWAVRDPIQKRERIKEPGQAARYEEVEADPGVQDKRLLVYEPEFANVLKQTERQGNTLSAVLRQAWESGDLATLTKNAPTRATGAHVSLLGHITVEELRRYLSTTEAANGFGNRFLWPCVRRSKELPEGGRIDSAALTNLQTRLAGAVAFAQHVGEMQRDEEAREIWCAVYGRLSADRPGLSGALLGRAEAHVLRLSLLYALLDCSPEIRAEHLMAALAVWHYCEQSVRHVFGDALGDGVADELIRLLRAAPTGLSRQELYNHFGRHQSSERIGGALSLLAEHGMVRCERQETAGRPREVWFATR
jgi:hypothetical protein